MLMQQGYGILQRLHFNKGYKSQKMPTVDFEQNAAHEFQEVESVETLLGVSAKVPLQNFGWLSWS